MNIELITEKKILQNLINWLVNEFNLSLLEEKTKQVSVNVDSDNHAMIDLNSFHEYIKQDCGCFVMWNGIHDLCIGVFFNEKKIFFSLLGNSVVAKIHFVEKCFELLPDKIRQSEEFQFTISA